MYIFNKYNVTHKHFFDIFDPKGKKTKITLVIIAMMLVQSIVNKVPLDYLEGMKQGISSIGMDGLFDYTIPLAAALMICYTFFEDYKNKRYELLAFYSHAKFNYIMLYRWFFFVSLFCAGSFVSGLFYYRSVSFIDLTNVLLSIRYIPNILFLCAFVLFITVFTKNSYASLLMMLTYFVIDMLSSARVFKFLSMGTNANNWYYSSSPEYYFINRISLVVLSIILVYVACKRSTRV